MINLAIDVSQSINAIAGNGIAFTELVRISFAIVYSICVFIMRPNTLQLTILENAVKFDNHARCISQAIEYSLHKKKTLE